MVGFNATAVASGSLAKLAATRRASPKQTFKRRSVTQWRRQGGEASSDWRRASLYSSPTWQFALESGSSIAEWMDPRKGYEFPEQAASVRKSGHPDSKEALTAFRERRENWISAAGLPEPLY